ncbi:MAG: nitrile hydratase accessory protein [Roseobacter sp.]
MMRAENAIAEPVFSEPWHAQVFALTVHLNEVGHLEWSDWAQAFGATLKRHGVSRELDGGDDYFNAWLETLEQFLVQGGVAASTDLATLKTAWSEAYLSTPHGAPVHLAE